MTPKKFAVGDVLFYVGVRGERCAPLTIERVGSEWYGVSQYGRPSKLRVSIETLVVHAGDFTHGRCYASEDDYLAVARLKSAWQRFRILVDRTYRPPASIDAIREAAKLLGLSLGEGAP